MDFKNLTQTQLLELAQALQEAGINLPKMRKNRKYLSVFELVDANPSSLGVDISKAPAFAQAVSESGLNAQTPFYYKRHRSKKVEVEPETEVDFS